MRSRIGTLLMALIAAGCGHTAGQMETLRTGAGYVEERAKQIEEAAKADIRPSGDEKTVQTAQPD